MMRRHRLAGSTVADGANLRGERSVTASVYEGCDPQLEELPDPAVAFYVTPHQITHPEDLAFIGVAVPLSLI